MRPRVLITGGAGFIGSHVADELLALGHPVRVLDSLDEQVHGMAAHRPDYLSPDVDLIVGDVRDPVTVRRALAGVDAVIHLAARVGVGQSMYKVGAYVGVNDLGTAVLLESLIERPVGRLVVASSMSVYGEGLYRDALGRPVEVGPRPVDQLKIGRWEPEAPDAGPLTPAPTPETHPPGLASVYALGKYVQEQLCLMIGRAYGIPTTPLRLFNVYGPRQALSNPYTGVLAIFAARLLNGRPPVVFEDGRQRRDFVHIADVVRAFRCALQAPEAAGRPFNVGSGETRSIAEVAAELALAVGRPEIAPDITGRCRVGDIRHCFADITQARRMLGYAPRVTLRDGLGELAGWLSRQKAVDRVEQASRELACRGLSA